MVVLGLGNVFGDDFGDFLGRGERGGVGGVAWDVLNVFNVFRGCLVCLWKVSGISLGGCL